jgi:wyosine [tRNA(Phe)-imidazoG37] synthetase (radical SAM superfamily)
MSTIPVAVITNGSLLFLPDVMNDLMGADVVLPTLCAARPATFAAINRAHPSLTIERIIEGQVKFRDVFKGKIWLEIMLVKGFNDSPDELELLRAAAERINPDKIQLNTVVRPPSNESARPLTIEELRSIRGFFGPKCEAVVESKTEGGPAESSKQKGLILELARRRPVTLHDIALGLGLDTSQVQTELARLLDAMQIECVEHHGVKYYRATGKT